MAIMETKSSRDAHPHLYIWGFSCVTVMLLMLGMRDLRQPTPAAAAFGSRDFMSLPTAQLPTAQLPTPALISTQQRQETEPAAAADWRAAAACSDPQSQEHIKMFEAVLDPHAVLGQLIKQKSKAWLQIGANTLDENNANDPIKKLLHRIPTWQKVFVEPIPQLHAKLQQSIKRYSNATALNVALSPDRKTTETAATMFCYAQAFNSSLLGKSLPTWANQICSFNASHIGRHFKGQKGVPVHVTAVSLEELIRRSGIDDPQVLMIDAEGYDYNALQQIPFERMRPAFVLYEHKHLHANRAAAEQLMRQHCYAVKVLDRENTVAMALFV